MIHRRQKNHQILGGKKSTIWFTIEIVQRVESERVVAQEVAERGEYGSCGKRECGEKLRGTPAPCGRRQSEFRELALTGRYCRVHLASVQFGSWI